MPWAAGLIRVLHAELERLACHLDVIVRLADGAGLAVATARFGWHKEQVLRLVGQLCGSRFGRGVVVPGGVSAAPAARAGRDAGRGRRAGPAGQLPTCALLTGTASFLDRLRRTGPLRRGAGARARRARADRHGRRATRTTPGGPALRRLRIASAVPRPAASGRRRAGPAARSGCEEIAAVLPPAAAGGRRTRRGRPAGAAARRRASPPTAGPRAGRKRRRARCSTTWPYQDGRITRCRARSASFHNLVLMHEVFAGDILTDFPFIEASFGLSVGRSGAGGADRRAGLDVGAARPAQRRAHDPVARPARRVRGQRPAGPATVLAPGAQPPSAAASQPGRAVPGRRDQPG